MKNLISDHNIFWSTRGRDHLFKDMTFTDWKQKGFDQHSIVANPIFVDPEKFDFRLKPNSPALKIGFKPFDCNKAGVYGDPEWVNKAKSATFPPLEIAPAPPPVSIHETFESNPVGLRPAGAEIHVENKGDSIAVTDETAASGVHSLKILDAPGLRFTWNPHYDYNLNHTDGITLCSFDMRIGEGVLIKHEWRDSSSSPYQVGPSFRVNGTKLNVGGKSLMELPLGKWVHFEIVAGLGGRNKGKWNLAVTLPGKKRRLFKGLKNGSTKFEKLRWVGFVSNATKKTVFYLDNLKLINSRKQ